MPQAARRRAFQACASDANKDRGRSARTARQRPPSRSPVQADNSPILQETRLLWQRRAFPSQHRGILRSALPRIAAFRETLFLLMFKLLLAQRIEAVRVSARSKQNNRDKRQDQNNHRMPLLVGKGVHGRFGISGGELCDDHHTLPPLLFVAPPPFGGGPGEC